MAMEHSLPGQAVDVGPLGGRLRDGQTTALLKARQLEIMRVVLGAGKEMREHRAPGEITLQCMEGLIEVCTGGSTLSLRPGQLVLLPAKAPHSVRALEDSSALLTMCLRTV